MSQQQVETLEYLRSVAKPGECLFCGEPAKLRSMSKEAVALRKKNGTSNWYETCGDPFCYDVAYNRCYKRAQRLKRGIKPRNQKESSDMSVQRSRTAA